jgi:hypothetical protein
MAHCGVAGGGGIFRTGACWKAIRPTCHPRSSSVARHPERGRPRQRADQDLHRPDREVVIPSERQRVEESRGSFRASVSESRNRGGHSERASASRGIAIRPVEGQAPRSGQRRFLDYAPDGAPLGMTNPSPGMTAIPHLHFVGTWRRATLSYSPSSRTSAGGSPADDPRPSPRLTISGSGGPDVRRHLGLPREHRPA